LQIFTLKVIAPGVNKGTIIKLKNLCQMKKTWKTIDNISTSRSIRTKIAISDVTRRL